jgi:hypothetical protein
LNSSTAASPTVSGYQNYTIRKVFISWSGRRSKETADVLNSWIRQVIQAAETWISLDIQKGIRWNDQIKNELEESKVGIICLNKENLQSEWILFEAGALSKTKDGQVCTFLLDVNPADIKPPLGQFQHTLYNKDDLRKLVHTINNKIIAIGEKTIPEKDLNEVFEVFFPKLDEKLARILNEKSQDGNIKRTDREILEEILQTIRASKMPGLNEIYERIYRMTIENQMQNEKLMNIWRNDLMHTNDAFAKQNMVRILKYFTENPEFLNNLKKSDEEPDNINPKSE